MVFLDVTDEITIEMEIFFSLEPDEPSRQEELDESLAARCACL